jgi:hypothetical protein
VHSRRGKRPIGGSRLTTLTRHAVNAAPTAIRHRRPAKRDELFWRPRTLSTLEPGRFVSAVAVVFVAVGMLIALLGTVFGIETQTAPPSLAAVTFAPNRPPSPADPEITQTVTTVVTQTSVTTVTTTAPTTVTTTSTTTVPTTVYTTVTTNVPGPATSTQYVCGAGYHYDGNLCVGNGPIVR